MELLIFYGLIGAAILYQHLLSQYSLFFEGSSTAAAERHAQAVQAIKFLNETQEKMLTFIACYNVVDRSSDGEIQGLIDRIPDLKELGVNCADASALVLKKLKNYLAAA